MKKLILALVILTCSILMRTNFIHNMEPEQGYMVTMPQDLKKLILSAIAKSNSVTETMKNLRALATTNQEFNELFNNPWIARDIVSILKKRFNYQDLPITEMLQIDNYYVNAHWKLIENLIKNNDFDTTVENITDVIFASDQGPLQDSLQDPWIIRALMRYLTTHFNVSSEEVVDALPIESIKNYIELSKKLGEAKTVQEIKNLITNGADVNFNDEDTGSPLFAAIKQDTPTAVITEMIAAGANPNTQDPILEYTPLMLAIEQYIESPATHTIATIKLLLTMYPDLSLKNIAGDNALDLAEKLSEIYFQRHNNDKKQRTDEIIQLIKNNNKK